jgi:prepilin-type N-terminal cleavage/methylation domain-containing protein
MARSKQRSRSETRIATSGPNGVTLLELLVVMAIIGIMLGLLLPAIHLVHQNSLRTACDSNVHQLVIAMQTYGDLHRTFVPAPDPECPVGWTIAILPFMEEGTLADLFKVAQPRTSPANMAAGSRRPTLFVCPVTPDVESTMPGIGITHYVLIVDPKNRQEWKRGGWQIRDAPEGSRNPWVKSPEIPWDQRGYPAPHPTAFGF